MMIETRGGAALVMRELEGRSYAEIADTIGVSVAAVETLIFRARRSLRLRASALRTLAAVPLPGSLAQLFESGGVVAGGGSLVGAGFLVKAAAVPFHFWLADAYAAAPAPVGVLLAGVMSDLGVYAIARIYWTVFSGPFGAHSV